MKAASNQIMGDDSGGKPWGGGEVKTAQANHNPMNKQVSKPPTERCPPLLLLDTNPTQIQKIMANNRAKDPGV